MRIALLLDDPAAIVDPGGAEKARDVERVGKPIDLDGKPRSSSEAGSFAKNA